jgi:hypothetical protein
MIRPACFRDVPAIERLIRAQHAASRYAASVPISGKALSALALSMVAQMGQHGPQGSHVAVAVRDGRVAGFIAGVLQRVYSVGTKLEAVDLFLVNSGSAGDLLKLVDSYVAWASANPKVVEVKLSWTDTMPGAARIAGVYRRKGFARVGEVFEMRLDGRREAEAA